MKLRYQVLLLTIAVLVVYYPSIFGQINTVDDFPLVTSMLNTGPWTLREIFLPGGSEGLYFRPLTLLTYHIDKELWFMEDSFLHLENILLHLVNVILVFLIARILVPEEERKSSVLPVVSALCFGLHPLATEPVNWISSRPDLLAGTFILSSALNLFVFKSTKRKRFLLFSAISFVLGILSKEVALAFLPGALVILASRKQDTIEGGIPIQQTTKRIVWKSLLFFCLGGGAVLAFLFLRHKAFTTDSPRIGMTLKFIFNDIDGALLVMMKTFGFYMKKLFWPFPLNFAIVEIDPLYELLAVPFILATLLIFVRRTFASAAFVAGVFLIMPSFAIAFNQVAWTPFAERYIYIASAFMIIAIVNYAGRRIHQDEAVRVLRYAIPCLLVILGGATLHRNFIWKTNLSLYADTVQKSPDFHKVWNEYGTALYYSGELDKAVKSYAKSSSLNTLYYSDAADLNMAEVLRVQGKDDEAEQVYQRVLKMSKGTSKKGLDHYLDFLAKRSKKVSDKSEFDAIKAKEMTYSKVLYELTAEPLVLFRMGTIAREKGDRRIAMNYYAQAFEQLPAGSMYKNKSKDLMEKMKTE